MGSSVNKNMSKEVPDLCVIVVSYNTAYLIDEMMSKLSCAAERLKLQVIVVDNASSDGSAALIRERYPTVDLVESPVNLGFGRANGLVLPRACARYVLLLNTDAFVAPDTLEKTLAYMEANPDCGVLGVKLVGRDGELQPSCRYFPTPWNVFLWRTGLSHLFLRTRLVDDMAWDHASVRDCDWVPGCYYLMRRDVIDQVGLFDPRYFLYYEEVDHCRAVKAAGWRVIYFPDTQVVHIGGESAKSQGELSTSGRQLSALQAESEMLYFRKHHGLSGVMASAVLEHVAALWLTAKHLLRGRGLRSFGTHVRTMRLWWHVARQTGLGTKATR